MSQGQHGGQSVIKGLPPQRGRFNATVADHRELCREHHRLVLRLPSFPISRPGQFVQVACRDLDLNYSPECEFDWQPEHPLGLGGRELMSPLALLRRPFSLGGRRDTANGVELDIIYRTVGVGTRWLTQLRNGDAVQLIGPLGNSFELPPANVPAILVGGGVGIPPMLYLAEALTRRKAVVFAGALTRDLLPLTVTADAPEPKPHAFDPLYNIDEFARHGIPAVITTDDGSYGFRGLVTQALEQYLDRYFPTNGSVFPVVYTCGPEGMMKRVGQIAMDRGLGCQISVERAMACGMGTCQSCCIKVSKPDASQPPLAGREWCWRLACTDGPVFEARDLLW
jgi:dihydroorotate dehydrogenase electron transfer subunit